MAEKARLFGDKEICAKIMESTEPNKIKALGRKVKNFDQAVWDACKYSIVLNGNYLKFIQNPKLKEFLLSTGDKVLAEASPYDGIWGIRMGEKSPNVRNPMEWQGENLLGFALMEVREELRRVCANEKLIDWKTVEN